jgi:hypothetical protein
MEKAHELGYFGNIWVRQNVLKNKGDFAGGHYHLFDHVSLLAKGIVEVEIEGYPPKQFVAPTFIVIKKERPIRQVCMQMRLLHKQIQVAAVQRIHMLETPQTQHSFKPMQHSHKQIQAVHHYQRQLQCQLFLDSKDLKWQTQT